MRGLLNHLIIATVLLVLSACGPDEPPPPAEEPAPSPIVGTWDLDAETLVDSYIRMAVRELEAGIADGTLAPEAHQSILDQSRRHAAENFGSHQARFVFADDGTFASTGSNGAARGTWIWERGALTLFVHQQGGKKFPTPVALAGSFADGVILLRPEPDKDYAMTLRRVTSPRAE